MRGVSRGRYESSFVSFSGRSLPFVSTQDVQDSGDRDLTGAETSGGSSLHPGSIGPGPTHAPCLGEFSLLRCRDEGTTLLCRGVGRGGEMDRTGTTVLVS